MRESSGDSLSAITLGSITTPNGRPRFESAETNGILIDPMKGVVAR